MNGDGASAHAPYACSRAAHAALEEASATHPPAVRMAEHALPPTLDRLLNDAEHAEGAWATFVAEHSRLLLHVARSMASGADETMDMYGSMLERLRRDDHRVLRGYVPTPRSKFTTWLVVVARRMCLDYRRHRFGRPRSTVLTPERHAERISRWRLATFGGGSAGLTRIIDSKDGPEQELRARELSAALERALTSLDTDDQLLLRLRFDDDRSVPEIARLLGAPTPFHVYRRLRAICSELRRLLEGDGHLDGAP